MSRILRLVSATLALILIAAACGDDSSDSAGDPRSDEERAADVALAETFLLTLEDLPAGWQVEPDDNADDESDNDDEPMAQQLAECLGVESDQFESVDHSASSPDFLSPTGLRAKSEVAATPSVEWATERVELFAHESLPGCLNELFTERFTEEMANEEAPPGVTYGDPQISRITFPEMGDGTQAVRITIPVSVDETDVEIYADMVLVRQGRFGVTMTFQGVIDPFPAELAEELTGTVVERIAAGN